MPPPRLVILVAISAACSCTGCDTIHGVSRTIPLRTLPSPEAVEQAIRATPGVTKVTRRDIPPEESSSLYKGKIEEAGFAQFWCRDAASGFAAVEAKETSEAGKELYIYCMWMNQVPTEGELSKARGLIDRVANSLHERGPTIPAPSSSDDKFIGISDH